MSAESSAEFSPVELSIYWGRLRAAADEAGLTLARTAVAGIIRQMRDLACVFFNADRGVVVQDSVGDPGLRGAMPNAVNFILNSIPPDELEPGDVILTNDPWGCTGHLLDLTVLLPVFSRGALVGFVAAMAHHADIGGLTDSTALDVYEEGFWIPPIKYQQRGQVNATLHQLIVRNVRVPDQVVPDIRAQIAAATLLARRVQTMAVELGEARFVDLTREILDRTEATTRQRLAELPRGGYRAELVTDSWLDRMGNETERLRIEVAIEIADRHLLIDYSGTSAQIPVGINSNLGGMTMGYTLTALKSLVDPRLPLNQGFFRCFDLTAPEGTLVNSTAPAPSLSRAQVAFLLPEVIYRALAPAIPERVIAACGGIPPWTTRFVGRVGKRNFAETYSPRGGLGAGQGRDGVACMAFPGNVRNLPLEVFEEQVPMVCERKELRTDSAGPGRWRGGLGQELTFRVLDRGALVPDGPIRVNLRGGGRVQYRVDGLLGGQPAGRHDLRLNGQPIRSGNTISMRPGDQLTFCTEGGGGYGRPEERAPEAIRRDVELGYVSEAAAREVYGALAERALGPAAG